VETRCSGWAVNARVRGIAKAEPDSLLARLIGEGAGHEAKHLGNALGQNDPLAQRLLAEVADDLAFGLSHVVHLMHPQIIIMGGGLSGIGEPLRAAAESALRRFVMDAFAPGPKIALAALGEDAVPMGALELARRGQGAEK
jgi:glucokinase